MRYPNALPSTNIARVAVVACATAWLVGCSDSSDPESPFEPGDTTDVPTNLFIQSFTAAAGPMLAWTPSDDEPLRYRVEWWVGAASGAEVVEIGTPDGDVATFTHADYRSDAVNNYRVRAEFNAGVTDPTAIERFDPRLLVPKNATMNRPADGEDLTLTWNPPDYQTVDEFRIRTFDVGPRLELIDRRDVPSLGSLEATIDLPVPMGGVFGDRRRYTVETVRREASSAPIVAGELSWQFPTTPASIGFDGPTSSDVEIRYEPDWSRAGMIVAVDGGPSTYEHIQLTSEPAMLSSIVVTAADGELAGAPVASDRSLVAHRESSGTVTLVGYTAFASGSDWSRPVASDQLPVVAAAATEATGLLAYEATLELVDASDGSTLDTVDLPSRATPDVVLDAVADGDIVYLVRRASTGIVLDRVRRSSGAIDYSAPFSLAAEGIALELSGNGDFVAIVSSDDTIVVGASTGTAIGPAIDGRAQAFTLDGLHVIALDGGGVPFAVRLDAGLAVEDVFGTHGLVAGFLSVDGLMTMVDDDGFVRVYRLVRGWSVLASDPSGDRRSASPAWTWTREVPVHAL